MENYIQIIIGKLLQKDSLKKLDKNSLKSEL